MMKALIGLFINSITLLFLSGSCSMAQSDTSSKNKNSCSLKIIISDTAFNMRLCDYSALSINEVRKKSSNWDFDKLTKSYIYSWDSMVTGDYHFISQSIFNRSFNISFHLAHDTTITITNVFNFQPVNIIEKPDLLKEDSIEMVYKVNGCFANGFEKLTIIKRKRGNYSILKFNPYEDYENQWKLLLGLPVKKMEKKIGRKVIRRIYKLETESIKLKEQLVPGEILRVSTTRQDLYILADNKLFIFNDWGIEWDLYNQFKKQYFP